MNSINAIPASIRHAFVMADGSPLEDSWLCHIYADDLAKQDEYPSLADKIERILKEEELLSLRNVATGLLMFLTKYYNKVKQTNPPKFVLNSENKEISIFIVEFKKLILKLDNACLHSEVNSSANKYEDIIAKMREMEFYLEKLNVWAKNKFTEVIK